MAGKRNKNQFINGLEFANLAVCSDLPLKAWDAISEIPQNDSAGLIRYKVTQIPSNGTKIIAFSSSPAIKFFEGEDGKDLVSVWSRDPLFGFLCTKGHPTISIHKAAIYLFVNRHDELSKLKAEIDVKNPLIITGHSLGGSIASLFTLWLLDSSYSIVKTSRRPLCITFGSPLLGDNAFQEAISEHPTWISCFLHIISNHDPIPTTLVSTSNGSGASAVSLHSSPASTQSSSSVSISMVYIWGFIKVIVCILAMLVRLISFSSRRILTVHLNRLLCYLTALAPNPTGYMPFGTSLFLSDTGSASFEESGSVLELIKKMSSGDLSQEIIDYGGILKKLKYKAINEDDEMVGDDSHINTLREGITLQMHAATGANQEVTEMDSLVKTIEMNIANFLGTKAFDPNNKLNEMKIQMIYMEMYKKTTMKDGGYYDLYKNAASRSGRELASREKLKKHKLILAQYWDKAVMKIEKMPKREGANNIPFRWLYAGTNYRRMVEPLDIAEYYKQGNTDYLTAGNARSKHYILLEQWQKNVTPAGRKKPCSMTEDSCFWAHLEEAILSCNVLKERKIINCLRLKSLKSSNNLIEFEKYIMKLILTYAVSTEIFLERSSFMNWWTDYKRIKGPEYKSELTAFMENEKLGDGSMVLNEYLESSK